MKNGYDNQNDLLLEVHACDTFKDPNQKPQHPVLQVYKFQRSMLQSQQSYLLLYLFCKLRARLRTQYIDSKDFFKKTNNIMKAIIILFNKNFYFFQAFQPCLKHITNIHHPSPYPLWQVGGTEITQLCYPSVCRSPATSVQHSDVGCVF